MIHALYIAFHQRAAYSFVCFIQWGEQEEQVKSTYPGFLNNFWGPTRQ